MRFVDTNVLLYAVSTLPEDSEKRRRARELLREHDLAVSVQVLQEFYHQATRPTRPERLSDGDAIAFLGTLLKFPVQDVTLALFRDAVAVSKRFRLSY
jgi:predicted nucleic acid-binding protein